MQQALGAERRGRSACPQQRAGLCAEQFAAGNLTRYKGFIAYDEELANLVDRSASGSNILNIEIDLDGKITVTTALAELNKISWNTKE